MSSPDLQTVIIACPSCGTRYQVAFAAIGMAGRDVQCARCNQPWHAVPEPLDAIADDRLTPDQEAALDAAFEAEARDAVVEAAWREDTDGADTESLDTPLGQRAQPAPAGAAAAVVRPGRATAIVIGLATLLALLTTAVAAVAFRDELTRLFPAFGGAYERVGLMQLPAPDLAFGDTTITTIHRDRQTSLRIGAEIRSVADSTEAVPPVLVTLVDRAGTTIHEWTVTPPIAALSPGESYDFSTEVTPPPADAASARLRFAPADGLAALD